MFILQRTQFHLVKIRDRKVHVQTGIVKTIVTTSIRHTCFIIVKIPVDGVHFLHRHFPVTAPLMARIVVMLAGIF